MISSTHRQSSYTGAYTARALCGMLEKVSLINLICNVVFVIRLIDTHQVGLLSVGNDEQAWQIHMKEGNDALAANVRLHFLGLVCISTRFPPDRHLIITRDTVKSTKHKFQDPQTESFVSYVYHALALDERRLHFHPRYYRMPTRPSINRPIRESSDDQTLPTRICERWFVGDHADIGGRFPFGTLVGDALANPPFRWIVWAAARAAHPRPLLFNLRAFLAYSPILIYNERAADDVFDHIIGRGLVIHANYLINTTPEMDSKNAATDDSPGGRPAAELRNVRKVINDAFETPSIWVPAQLLKGKGSRGNARRLEENTILHASVRGKLATDPSYGGKRRDVLQSLAGQASEAV